MLEILFGESEAGSLKIAKGNDKVRKSNDGPTTAWGDGKRMREPKEWTSVPGTPDEVFCFPYLLDVGDIQKPFDSQYRHDLILSMYTQSGWDTTPEYIHNLSKNINTEFAEYKRFLENLKKGYPVRIWYSHAAYSFCGLHWVCSKMSNLGNDIYVVELPEYKEIPEKHAVVEYINWGEVSAEEFSSFLHLQKRLPLSVRKLYEMKWTDLVRDNSPLRAVVNGKLTGVSEEFYDHWILKILSREPMIEARLIGEILGKYTVSVSDWWYAARIERMIKDGKIKVSQDSKEKYRRLLCLA